MWYEILPTAGIICAAVTFPSVFNYFFHKLIYNGNPYRRVYTPIFNKDLFLRDMRLSGNPYKIQGLDNIPDDVRK
uniref:Uncharacterized protein n=1 Tax=Panstrongylus lignarius TaxID=156445 RepID=A0A224XTM5_9HEMI